MKEKVILNAKVNETIYEELYMDGRNIRFKLDDSGFLNLHFCDGSIYNNVKPYRLLPLSNKNLYIRICNEYDEEIGILKDIEELEPKSKKLLQTKLDEYYMIPKIKRIKSIETKHGVARWNVETDAGETEFHIRIRSSDIKVFPGRKIILRDSDDNRYEITDYTKLPRKSYLKIQGEL